MFNANLKLLRLFELDFSVGSLLHLSNDLVSLLIGGEASEGDDIDMSALDYSLNAKIQLLIYFISFINEHICNQSQIFWCLKQ